MHVTLADLIAAAMDHPNVSYRVLIERAWEAGHVITSAQLSQLRRRRPKTFPAPCTLRALAAALGVDVSMVLAAAAEGLGIVVYEPVGHGGVVVFGTAAPLSVDEVARCRERIAAAVDGISHAGD